MKENNYVPQVDVDERSVGAKEARYLAYANAYKDRTAGVAVENGTAFVATGKKGGEAL